MSILNLDTKKELVKVDFLSNLLIHIDFTPPDYDSDVISLFSYITLVVGDISSADGFCRAYTRREINLFKSINHEEFIFYIDVSFCSFVLYDGSKHNVVIVSGRSA